MEVLIALDLREMRLVRLWPELAGVEQPSSPLSSPSGSPLFSQLQIVAGSSIWQDDYVDKHNDSSRQENLTPQSDQTSEDGMTPNNQFWMCSQEEAQVSDGSPPLLFETQTKRPASSKKGTQKTFQARICSQCQRDSTSCWRWFQGQLLCNSCGLSKQKLERLQNGKTLKPKVGQKRTRRSLSQHLYYSKLDVGSTCANCETSTSPTWRRGPQGIRLCNACGIYYQQQKAFRPLKSANQK